MLDLRMLRLPLEHSWFFGLPRCRAAPPSYPPARADLLPPVQAASARRIIGRTRPPAGTVTAQWANSSCQCACQVWRRCSPGSPGQWRAATSIANCGL